ncbi:MAG TPA: hypothetical protein VK645_01850 [Chitinophagaceae bacterium]|nr:hypothetical protein [Chitinophagaceae bacterium]
MNGAKGCAGVLMLLLGAFLLFTVLIINSGHTSSAFSTSEDVLYSVGGVFLIVGGVYAISTADKKRR